jgi:trigger factor
MDPHSLPAELFRDNAERRVKLGLVLNRIVEVESLEAEPERVEKILDDVAAPYSEPEQVKTWYHANEEQMQQIRSAAIEEQVIDLVLERAKVEDVERSYDEVLAAARGDAPAQGDAEPEADGEETA